MHLNSSRRERYKTTPRNKSHEMAPYLDANAVANQGVIDEQNDDCADYRD